MGHHNSALGFPRNLGDRLKMYIFAEIQRKSITYWCLFVLNFDKSLLISERTFFLPKCIFDPDFQKCLYFYIRFLTYFRFLFLTLTYDLCNVYRPYVVIFCFDVSEKISTCWWIHEYSKYITQITCCILILIIMKMWCVKSEVRFGISAKNTNMIIINCPY